MTDGLLWARATDPVSGPGTRRGFMSCPRCGDRNIGEIRFGVVASGVTFQYCRYCENRWWTRASERVALADVLQGATVLARAS
jgi:hypothetical protein